MTTGVDRDKGSEDQGRVNEGVDIDRMMPDKRK